MDEPAGASAPQQIVVAGSVGKASIAAMIAALLHAGGQRVVHFNAHSLHSPLERLTIDGRALDAETAEALFVERESLDAPADRSVASLLEPCLRRSGAAWLVLSGVQPRPGSTQLLALGPILPDGPISAADLASAIVRGLPAPQVVITTLQRESVLDVLRPAFPDLIEVAARCQLARGRADLDGQEFRLRTEMAEYRLRLPVLGNFQIENAAAALLAVEQLRPLGVEISPTQARTALESLRLLGRLEVIKRRPLVVVDSGTSGQALRRVGEALRDLAAGRRLRLIVDFSAGLEPAAVAAAFPRGAPEVIAVGAGSDPTALRDAFSQADIPLQTAASVELAVDQAVEAADPGEAIAVLGSRAAAAAARAQILGLLPENLRLD